MPVITRSRMLMEFTERSAEFVYFECNLEEGLLYSTVSMPIWKWQDLGEPRELTMTLEPGDLLNDGN